MKNQDALKVKIKGPRFSVLEGIASSGTLLAIPAILYLIIARLLFKKEEHLTWRVQVLKHLGFFHYRIVHEEVFDSADKAWCRYWELERQATKAQLIYPDNDTTVL